MLLRILACLSVVATVLSVSVDAHAGEVTIEYSLTSTLPLTPGLPGTMTLKYQATDINTLVAGAVVLSNLSIGGAVTSGSLQYGLVAPISGTFDGAFAFGTQTATIDFTRIINFTPPLTVTGSWVLPPMAVPMFPATQGFFAIATGNGALFSYSGNQGVYWTGQETNRTFVPEPSGIWMLVAGAACLVGLSGTVRRPVSQLP